MLGAAVASIYPASVIGWLGDFIRFWWGLLYWNTRKSYFQLRRQRAPCPCQNPSDSGRARETGCDAAHFWHDPARFRRVCPLVFETLDGPRCSVDAANVRPFWARAAAYYGGAAVAVYVAAVLGAALVLAVVGYPVSPLALAWPPSWHELRVARSAYFVAKARRSLNENRINEAVLSLDVAYRTNPGNYDAGFQLAQLLSLGQPEVADQIFAFLMRDHPAQRAGTAEAWLRFLLVHGRLKRAGELAAARVVEDPAHRPVWLHILFLVTHRLGDDQALLELATRQAAHIEPVYIDLLNWELLIRQGRGAQLLSKLKTELPTDAGSYGPYFQISRLTSLGRPAEAMAMLDRYRSTSRIPEADAFRLRLEAYAALNRPDLLINRLDQGTINSRELDLISIHLARHPDPATLAALARSLQRSQWPSDVPTFGAYTDFFLACAIAGDWDKLHIAASRLKEISGSPLVSLDKVEAFFKGESGSAGMERVLPTMPAVSLEMIFALYDRYGGQPAPVVSVKIAPRP